MPCSKANKIDFVPSFDEHFFALSFEKKNEFIINSLAEGLGEGRPFFHICCLLLLFKCLHKKNAVPHNTVSPCVNFHFASPLTHLYNVIFWDGNLLWLENSHINVLVGYIYVCYNTNFIRGASEGNMVERGPPFVVEMCALVCLNAKRLLNENVNVCLSNWMLCWMNV